jgi:hypothetical protein
MWVALLLAPPARAAEVVAPAAPWFSPLVGLTAPVAQVLPALHPQLPSQRPLLSQPPVPAQLPLPALAQVQPCPQPPILAKGLPRLPGPTHLPVLAHRVLAWRQLVEIPAQCLAGPVDLPSRRSS